jgi:hypothetical protein
MKTEGQQLEMELEVLTVEQEKMVQDYIERSTRDTQKQIARAEREVKFLLENGFHLGYHFENTFKTETVTRNVNLGWGDNRFETEVTVDTWSGGVYLLYDVIASNPENDELVIKKYSASFGLTSDNKIESYSIVGSSRAVKPKTILDKIGEKNLAAKNQLSFLITKNLNFDVAISQLKHEFPTATSVEKRDEWITGTSWERGYSKEVIVVKFANDSSIMFDLDYKGEKRIFKVYDIEEAKMTNEQKVERLVKRVG